MFSAYKQNIYDNFINEFSLNGNPVSLIPGVLSGLFYKTKFEMKTKQV